MVGNLDNNIRMKYTKKNSTYFGCSFYNKSSSLSAKSFCLLGYK